jgi:hypothetical protein
MFNLKRGIALLGTNGLPLTTEDGKPFSYGEACRRAVVSNHEGDSRETIEHKMKRWELFKKLSPNGDETVTLNAEETVLLKERLHLSYGPLILGQIVDSLEGK